jgi:5'-deoxynucleotidase YfbR-like HD superfamily hydrolase
MEKQTLDQLTAAFKAVEKDLSERVADLAAKSSSGTLSEEERAEYEQIVRFNDLLSMLKLQAEEYWAPRIAS